MKASRSTIMIFLSIWVFSYILAVILTEIISSNSNGYLLPAISRSLLWPILIIAHFLFVRKFEETAFDGFWLVSLYAMLAGWILFAAVNVGSALLILSIPIVFLSLQLFRLSKMNYGNLLKHIRSSFLGSLTFSLSLVILVCSLSFFFSSEAASVLLLFALLIPSVLLTHFRADVLSGTVFAWFSFAVGMANSGASGHIAVAGFSLGPMFILLSIFSSLLASEDPSKKVFATVNPSKPVDEDDLRIRLDADRTRSK